MLNYLFKELLSRRLERVRFYHCVGKLVGLRPHRKLGKQNRFNEAERVIDFCLSLLFYSGNKRKNGRKKRGSCVEDFFLSRLALYPLH